MKLKGFLSIHHRPYVNLKSEMRFYATPAAVETGGYHDEEKVGWDSAKSGPTPHTFIHIQIDR